MSDYNEDEIIQMLDDISAPKRIKLTNDWERDFISNCYKTVDNRIMLSEKQLNTLNSLWERVTANG